MEQLLKELRNNWIILIFMGTLIMSWTTFSSRLTQAESDIKDSKIIVDVKQIDDKIEFSVKDFGKGIDSKYTNKIF